MSHYMRILKTEICEFVSTHRYTSLSKLQTSPWRRDIEIKTKIKERNFTLVHTQPLAKQFKSVDSWSGWKKGLTCDKCGKTHEVVYQSATICYNCGRKGHYVWYCRLHPLLLRTRICYHCIQVGHMKDNCPTFVVKMVQALAPSTLQIIDVRQRRDKALKAKGRSF